MLVWSPGGYREGCKISTELTALLHRLSMQTTPRGENDKIAVDELLARFAWFYSANGLKLNESRCHILVVRLNKKCMTIKCAGQDEVDGLRLLCLYINYKLT